MKDKELLKIVKGFRKGILGKNPPNDMCYAVSAPLQSYLSICGIQTTLIEGELVIGNITYGHFWLQLPDGRIIDPTASQFNWLNDSGMPEVYIGRLPRWYTFLKAA